MNNEVQHNPETVKVILNTLQKEYEAEDGRVKFITSKVQMMFTASGIFLTAVYFVMQSIADKKLFINKAVFEKEWLVSYSTVFLKLSMLSIFVAIVIFLYVLITKTFSRIKYKSLVFNQELTKAAVEVESRLIATYELALKANIPIGDKMAKAFKIGTILFAASVGMLIAVSLKIML